MKIKFFFNLNFTLLIKTTFIKRFTETVFSALMALKMSQFEVNLYLGTKVGLEVFYATSFLE